jgi:ABC-type nitrate/sulfonate/bicarbonate transport system permease component
LARLRPQRQRPGRRNDVTAGSTPLARRQHPPVRRALPALRIPERLFYGVIGFVTVLLLWEAVVRFGLIKGSLLSSPSRVITAAIEDFGSGVIWPHIGTSFLEWIVGFAVALVFAIPLGFLLGHFRRLEYLVDPALSALYATPTVALVPLIILVFGVGLPSKFAVVFLEAWITLTVSTINGAQSADKRFVDIAKSFRASPGLVFRSVTVPSAIPYIITGIRIGAGRALVGVVVAEFIASNIGLGFYISLNGTTLNTARVMLGILLLGGFGIFIGELIRRIEHRFDVWRPAIH